MRRSHLRTPGVRAKLWRVALVLAAAFGIAVTGKLVYAAELAAPPRPPRPPIPGIPSAPPAFTPSGENLALDKQVKVSGSTPCNANEGPEKAVNGSVSGGNSDKFCSLAEQKFLQVDLGSEADITGFVVRHAHAGGEPATLNTRDFTIEVSPDGVNFSKPVQQYGNTADVSTFGVTPHARYVRLNIINGTQANGGAARIYEFEVYGSRSDG